jgi:hypothetical protein
LAVRSGEAARREGISRAAGALTLKAVIAERKVFLSKRTLEYRCRLRVDDEARQVTFFEMLSEKGMGVSGGDVDMAPGFGFRKETYKTGAATRGGSIEEQSRLFAKDYAFSFRYERVREAVQRAAGVAGHEFKPVLHEKSV